MSRHEFYDMKRHIHVFPLTLAIVMLLSSSLPAFADTGKVISQLRDLHMKTLLVEKGAAKAIIVAPKNGRYVEIAREVHDKILDSTGADLKVYDDENAMPEKVLQNYNVIAIGNCSTNKFIETLYRQWYVILDIKYPGPGGHVVRSLHNPYGTGHNVIFLGGSDDQGVSEAGKVFIGMLGPGKSLSVGWTMKIKLGKGMEHPPVINTASNSWKVFSWQDSWRKTNLDAYLPGTLFGWNPISVAGILYYMTGQTEYLDTFKRLAMPRPDNIPAINRADSAFSDPADPIAKSDHYRSHLLDCVWNLIENSPFFNDQERLFITNKLLQHQLVLDPNNSFSAPNGDRHALWHMMNIYTGSRYFARYYPDAIWQKRIENVRNGFRSFIGDPTWAERDTLGWVSTSIEPVMDFFCMDGADEFITSGTAKTMMRGLEVLMNGSDAGDDFGGYLSISLMHKAAHMLHDGRYIWMVRQLAYDLDVFRIGQSYWPGDDLEVKAPLDLVGTITVAPLARTDWKDAQTSVPPDEAFQILSFRAGLDKTDDYFLFDGFNGLGRNPNHLNNITKLRMFGGTWTLVGYMNDISILYNGMVDPHVARTAGLKDSFATANMAYIEAEVPDMPESVWKRYFLYTKNKAIIFDKIVPRQAGQFDITRYWLMGPIKHGDLSSRQATFYGTLSLLTTDNMVISDSADRGLVYEHLSRDLKPEDRIIISGMLYDKRKPKALKQLTSNAYLVTGTESAFVSLGRLSLGQLLIDADFAYFDRGRLFLSRAKHFSIGEYNVFQSDSPITLLWDMNSGYIDMKLSSQNQVNAVVGSIPMKLGAGGTQLKVDSETESVHGKLSELFDALSRTSDQENASGPAPEIKVSNAETWKPEWMQDLKVRISVTAAAEIDATVWVAKERSGQTNLLKLNSQGAAIGAIDIQGDVLSLQTPRTTKQAKAFGLLVGKRDDSLAAYTADGKELWKVKAQIDPSFKIGDRYEAPWFTDPGPKFKMTGVYSILVSDLWNSGEDEIAIGRPSTVEFYTLSGQFKGRVATHWGNNTSLAVVRTAGRPDPGPLLIVGKSYTGNPSLTGINRNYKNVSDQMYWTIEAGYTNMHAWMQRGLSSLVVTDIDNDGTDDVIYSLSGHWNELRVYNGATGEPKWIKYFGPDKKETRNFVRGLAILPSNAAKGKMVVVGLANGWLHAFDEKGDLVWQKHFDKSVTAIRGFPQSACVVVGCEDGAVLLLAADGKIIREGRVENAVKSIELLGAGVVVAGENGTLSYYRVKGSF